MTRDSRGTNDDSKFATARARAAGLMYCLEYLEKNLDWLEEKLAPFRDAGYYFLFDCPGQAELYTHHEAFFRIVQRLMKLQYNVRGAALWRNYPYCCYGWRINRSRLRAVLSPTVVPIIARRQSPRDLNPRLPSPLMFSYARSRTHAHCSSWRCTWWTRTTAATPASLSPRRCCHLRR